MEIGFLNTHVAIVTLSIALLLFKTVLLLANKKDLLARVRSLKMIDPVLGTLMLITGSYLSSLYGKSAAVYLLGETYCCAFSYSYRYNSI